MSRRAQPYRVGPRSPGLALEAMLKGSTSSGFNPKDMERNVQMLQQAAKAQSGRPKRPTRPARPWRPPRV